MTVFLIHKKQKKIGNETANGGQDRKIPPALGGTNQIAGFWGFRPLASLEKNIL